MNCNYYLSLSLVFANCGSYRCIFEVDVCATLNKYNINPSNCLQHMPKSLEHDLQVADPYTFYEGTPLIGATVAGGATNSDTSRAFLCLFWFAVLGCFIFFLGPGQAGKTLATGGVGSGAGCLVLSCLVIGTGRLGIFFGGRITGVLILGRRLNCMCPV